MGVCGKYVNTFKEANLAGCVDISLDAHYPHYFFNVVSVDEDKVILASHNGGKEFVFPIQKRREREYAVISQKGWYELTFHRRAAKFEIHPMSGERF